MRLELRTMSLLKVPFLLFDSYVSDRSSTPPTPPPTAGEFVKETEKAQATFWGYENVIEKVSYNSVSTKSTPVD